MTSQLWGVHSSGGLYPLRSFKWINLTWRKCFPLTNLVSSNNALHTLWLKKGILLYEFLKRNSLRLIFENKINMFDVNGD